MSGFGKKNTARAGAPASFGKKTSPGARRMGAQPSLSGAAAPLSPQAQAFLQKERGSNDNFIGSAQPAAMPSYLSPASSPSGPVGKLAVSSRYLAWLVDLIVSIILMVPFLAILGSQIETMPEDTWVLLATVVILGVRYGYYFVMEASPLRATAGKLVCGIQVTAKDGSDAGVGRIFIRNTIGRFIADLTPFYVGYTIMHGTKLKQSLHDLISGTTVRSKTAFEPGDFGQVFV